MKAIFALTVFIVTVNSYSQSDWVNLGKEIGYDFYYKSSTVIRGTKTFVIVIGVPIDPKVDASGKPIKYASVDITFYKSSAGIRALITGHKYFYTDNTYKPAGLPKRDLPINYYVLLNKLYEMIK